MHIEFDIPPMIIGAVVTLATTFFVLFGAWLLSTFVGRWLDRNFKN